MAADLQPIAAELADRYRIVRELDAGGMATVYLADDLRHQRQVALEVLRDDLTASLGKERFLREVTIAQGSRIRASSRSTTRVRRPENSST